MLGHPLPAGEQIADPTEHGAEIDRHEAGAVLEDDVLAGDEAGAHPADGLAVEPHGLAAHPRGAGIAHQPHHGRRLGGAERITQRQRGEHAHGDGRGRQRPAAGETDQQPKQQRRRQQ
jgi:hypothetical protein